jgi:hypothetical protein
MTTAPFFPFRKRGSYGADGLRFFKTYVCNTPILNSPVAGAWHLIRGCLAAFRSRSALAKAVSMPILRFAINIVQAHRYSPFRVGGINEIHLYRFYLKSFRVAIAQRADETTIEHNGLGGSESKTSVQPLCLSST